MKILKAFILCLCFVFLSGCAVIKVKNSSTPEVSIAPGHTIHLPTPAQLNLDINKSQIVSAEYNIKGKIKSYSSQVQVEINAQKIVLVASSGWGGEVFSIVYNGKTIQSNSLPMPNGEVGIRHTLSDFIFSYASSELLQEMLVGSGVDVEVAPLKRTFTIDNKPVMIIIYQNKDPLKGDIFVRNLLMNYTVKIHTLD